MLIRNALEALAQLRTPQRDAERMLDRELARARRRGLTAADRARLRRTAWAIDHGLEETSDLAAELRLEMGLGWDLADIGPDELGEYAEPAVRPPPWFPTTPTRPPRKRP